MGIKELFQKLTEDIEFAARYKTFDSEDAFLAQAKDDGYYIDRKELEALIQMTKGGGLSDEVLKGVAGGKVGTWGDNTDEKRQCNLCFSNNLNILEIYPGILRVECLACGWIQFVPA